MTAALLSKLDRVPGYAFQARRRLLANILAFGSACGSSAQYDNNTLSRSDWNELRNKYWTESRELPKRALSGRLALDWPPSSGPQAITPNSMFTASDGCTLVVVDDISRALHLFDRDLRYRRSVYAAKGSERWFRSIVSISLAPGGGMMAAYLGSSDVAWLDSGGATPLSWGPVSDSVPPTRQIVALSESLIVDNWAASKLGGWSADWATKQLPLLVLREPSGRVLRTWGRFVPTGGIGLPMSVSRGHVFVRKDTAWFVNALTGVVSAVWDASGNPVTDGSTREWRIRPLFEPERVSEYVARNGGRVFPLAQYAIESIGTPSPGGDFLVVQALGWPSSSARGVPFVPRLVIVPYIGSDQGTESWVTVDAVRAALLFAGRVVTIETDSVSGERHIWEYPLPPQSRSAVPNASTC